MVVVVDVVVVEVVGASVAGVIGVAGLVLVGVADVPDADDGSSGALAAGSTATAWLHAAASKQAPISNVIRGERTTDNLQMADRGIHVFRRCSPTTHSVRLASKP